MNKIILGAGLGAGLLTAIGSAQAASCTEHARSIERSIRTGEPIATSESQMTIPSLGGALAPSGSAATVAEAGRTAADATIQEQARALQALAQAQIYGGLGGEGACLIALHEAVGLLGPS